MPTPLPCCLKVDVDTHDGMRHGVPRLLEVFQRHGVKATFFLSFGPDNSGRAIWNVFRQRGFLSKMLKTGAPSLYGWRTILSGTLLPARPIASSMPELVRRIADEGHEVGVHAWDHRLWQDHLPRLPRARVEEQVRLASESFAGILGAESRCMAAPAWLATRDSLEVQDARGLLYASDMRGGEPGFPLLDGYRSTTLQIPSTQPCIEELMTLGIRDPGAWVERVLHPPEWLVGARVMSLHAEVEGGPYSGFLESLLTQISREEAPVLRLEDYARDLLADSPAVRPAGLRPHPGRSGSVFAFLDPAPSHAAKP